MSNIVNRKALAGCAALVVALFPALLTAGQAHARNKVKANKIMTFDMPACPIASKTIPPTKKEFRLPHRNPLRDPVSIAGTIQVTDQTSSTVILLQTSLAADDTGLSFSRTVKTLQHATGSLTFDKGCTKTDPYGSNNCQWLWGEQVTSAFQGALQEDITAGKLIVDLNVNSTIPFQFSCPICGAPCTISIPREIDHGRWNIVWDVVSSLLQHQPPPDADDSQQ